MWKEGYAIRTLTAWSEYGQDVALQRMSGYVPQYSFVFNVYTDPIELQARSIHRSTYELIIIKTILFNRGFITREQEYQHVISNKAMGVWLVAVLLVSFSLSEAYDVNKACAAALTNNAPHMSQYVGQM